MPELEIQTNLTGRMVELRYPDGEGGYTWRRPRGRVSAAYVATNGYGLIGLCLWLEVEDTICASSFREEQAQIGDVVMVTTVSPESTAPAVIRIIKDDAGDSPLFHARDALLSAREDVVRALRLVDEVLHRKDKSDAT